MNTNDMIARTDTALALEWHLAHNHYPPVPAVMLPVCREAIRCAADGYWDVLVDLPEGVSYRGEDHAPVWAVVEQHHLAPFVEDAATTWAVANYEEEDGMFWSNALGWVPFADADLFTADERRALRLPDGGEWVPVAGDPM
jgi:hypothetical protein